MITLMSSLFLSFFSFLLGGCTIYALFWKNPFSTQKKEILDTLKEGVLICKKNGKICLLNRAAEKLLKIEKHQLGRENVFALKKKIDPILFDKCVQVLRQSTATRKSISLSFCIDREEAIFYDLTAIPLKKTNQCALVFHNTQFEKQIEQFGREFIANASHELRTPITIIKGFAETLRDLPTISETMLDNFIEKIVRNCKRMEHLVTSLLTLADLDVLPTARMQECDLVALVDSCIHTLLDTYGEVQVETWYNQDIITVLADPDLLSLAISNLLENGVKYSSSTPNLTITIEQKKDSARLSVADCGIGIPQEDLKKIFHRFYTVDKTHSRKLGGSGLGLSIVQAIIKKHRARIAIDSTLGSGTTVTLTF